jgi:hypothetical protein
VGNLEQHAPPLAENPAGVTGGRAATRIDYRNSAGEEFSMTIELINQLILISIAERGLPDVKTTNRFARLLTSLVRVRFAGY